MKTKLNSFSGRKGRFLIVAGCVLAVAAPALARLGPWSDPVSAEVGSQRQLNTAFVDGCPILSPDGLSLYMASTRPGGLGGIDIWVAHRATTQSGWRKPRNLGAPVNSAADDFCPTPTADNRLLFVSKRDDPAGDIYMSNRNGQTWGAPVNLGANVNSTAEEWSPSLYRDHNGNDVLYFSSTRAGGQDIYASVNFGPARPVSELNTEFDDARPNVSANGRQIVFDSTRPGTLGGPDIWTARRDTDTGPWTNVRHVPGINSAAAETRATLSYDRSLMLFGSSRPGGEGLTDIYVTRRTSDE